MNRIVVVLALVVFAGCDKKNADPPAGMGDKAAPSTVPSAAPPGASGKQVSVTVGEDGFSPSEIKVPKGEETTLVFTRTSDKTCATAVELPELGVKKELPLNQPVAVVVPSGEARTYGFQCGMGMYKSKVIVQ